MNADALGDLVALVLIAGCFAALLAIHLLVVLTDIRRELRRLRRTARGVETHRR